MMKQQKEFFSKVSDLEYYLIGCFRNEHQEMFCLFEKNADNDDKVYITGHEFDWEEEELDNSKFVFDKKELDILSLILKEHKKHYANNRYNRTTKLSNSR